MLDPQQARRVSPAQLKELEKAQAEAVEPGTKRRREREAAARAKVNEKQIKAHAEHQAEQKRKAEEALARHRELMREQFKTHARERYVAAGGAPADFDREFPAIWKEHLRQEAAKTGPAAVPEGALSIKDY